MLTRVLHDGTTRAANPVVLVRLAPCEEILFAFTCDSRDDEGVRARAGDGRDGAGAVC